VPKFPFFQNEADGSTQYQLTNEDIVPDAAIHYGTYGTALLELESGSDDRYACASEGVVGRQNVFFAKLDAIRVANLKTMKSTTWILEPFGATSSHFAGAGSVDTLGAQNGAQERNVWALDDTIIGSGHHTSKRGGMAICLASDAAHSMITAAREEDPVSGSENYYITDQRTLDYSLPLYYFGPPADDPDGAQTFWTDMERTNAVNTDLSQAEFDDFVDWTQTGTSIELFGEDILEGRVTELNQENFGRTFDADDNPTTTLYTDLNIYTKNEDGLNFNNVGPDGIINTADDTDWINSQYTDTELVREIQQEWRSQVAPSSTSNYGRLHNSSRSGYSVANFDSATAWTPAHGINSNDEMLFCSINKMNGWKILPHHRHAILVANGSDTRWGSEWTDGTAYQIGDIISYTFSSVKHYFKCVDGHTASSDNAPSIDPAGSSSLANTEFWTQLDDYDNKLATHYKYKSLGADGFMVICISQPDSIADEENVWGNLSSHIFDGPSALQNSYTGRKPNGYHAFQNSSSTTRITKIIAGVFPGVTYRMYFTAAYRPNYWHQGCRVYVSEAQTNTYAASQSRNHSDGVELIAYGEFTHEKARAINYNAINSNLDGAGQIINFTRTNPHDQNPATGIVDDKLSSKNFKIFWVEFTPKTGGASVEIMFETAFMPFHIQKPDNWHEIPPDDFFDSIEYTKFRKNWLNRFQGPWEYPPEDPQSAQPTGSNIRDATWFLDDVWVTCTRPCWAEEARVRYTNIQQGGFHLSIDQGDENNVNCGGDVILKNNWKDQLKKMAGASTSAYFLTNWTPEDLNGFFNSDNLFGAGMHIIRQHSHIQNWDPFCVDTEGHSTHKMYSDTDTHNTYSPCNYLKGLVYSPPNPGLFRLKGTLTNTDQLNSADRLTRTYTQDAGKGKIHCGTYYHKRMPTTLNSYNELWENVDDKDWEYFVDNDILSPVLRTPLNSTSLNLSSQYEPTLSPYEIDSRFQNFNNIRSFRHELTSTGYWVMLPLFGWSFFTFADDADASKTTAGVYPDGGMSVGAVFCLDFLGQQGFVFLGNDEGGVIQGTPNQARLNANGDVFFAPTPTVWQGVDEAIEFEWTYTNPCIWPWARITGGSEPRWIMFDLNNEDSVTWDHSNNTNLSDQVYPLNLHSEWAIGAPQNISPITTGQGFGRKLTFGHGNFEMGNQYFEDGTRLSKNFVGDYLVFNVQSLTDLFLSRPVTDNTNFKTDTPKPTSDMLNDEGVDNSSVENNNLYKIKKVNDPVL
jgi:hypothetical protein